MTTTSFHLETAIPELDSQSAPSIAAASLMVWEALAFALMPIIGEKGYTILFDRCIYLTLALHPWLDLPPHAPDAGRVSQLSQRLQRRPPADALAASNDLFTTFRHALAALIGEALTASIFSAIPGFRPLPNQENSS